LPPPAAPRAAITGRAYGGIRQISRTPIKTRLTLCEYKKHLATAPSRALRDMPGLKWAKIEQGEGKYYMTREQYDACNDQL